MIITPQKNGTYKVEITDWQSRMFRDLVKELKSFIANENNPLVNRLYPVAYQNDEIANSEYTSLTYEDLYQSHLAALGILEDISEIAEVSEDTLLKIMQAVNILRLVLGTRLGICDEEDFSEITEDHPDHNLWLIYHLLGEILSIIVDSVGN